MATSLLTTIPPLPQKGFSENHKAILHVIIRLVFLFLFWFFIHSGSDGQLKLFMTNIAA